MSDIVLLAGDNRLNVAMSPIVVEYTLTTSVSPWGTGYVWGGGVYGAGEWVEVEAQSYSGYVFDHWGGDASGTYSSTYVLMDGDKHVIAYFKEIAVEEYTLTLNVSPSGAGYVTGAGTYDAGAWATIRAYPYSGYEFDHWGGDYYGTDNPAQIVMAFDKTVTAYFTPTVPPEQYSLICKAEPSYAGYVTRTPSKTLYDYGEVVKLTATPLYDYIFQYWDCDGEWISGAASFNFMVTADHTLTAHFTR